MSIRTEIFQDLQPEQGPRVIPISMRGGREARQGIDSARDLYEKARAEVLRHELALYYRVAIFGSARLKPDSPEFKFVTSLTQALVEAKDVDIVTGGGTGVMEAAHLGTKLAVGEAKEHGKRKRRGRNLGITVELPLTFEPPNPHIDIRTHHAEFSTRLQEFIDKTYAAYFAPGGIGTLLELSMLIQTKQVEHLENDYPIIAHPFWKPIVEAWNRGMYDQRIEEGTSPLIGESDKFLVTFSDDIAEITNIIAARYDQWRTNIRDRIRIIPKNEDYLHTPKHDEGTSHLILPTNLST